MTNVDNTLTQRGTKYGDFKDNADVMIGLLRVMQVLPAESKYSNLVLAGLIMDAAKTCRIVNGDPNYTDNWHDKQGYAKLVEDRLLQSTDGQ